MKLANLKKLSLFSILVAFLLPLTARASCLLGDNSPVPFPLDLSIIQQNENHWMSTPNLEFSIRLRRISDDKYKFWIVSDLADERKSGVLIASGNKMCSLKAPGAFCLYTNDNSLRVKTESRGTCLDLQLDPIKVME